MSLLSHWLPSFLASSRNNSYWSVSYVLHISPYHGPQFPHLQTPVGVSVPPPPVGPACLDLWTLIINMLIDEGFIQMSHLCLRALPPTSPRPVPRGPRPPRPHEVCSMLRALGTCLAMGVLRTVSSPYSHRCRVCHNEVTLQTPAA